MSHSHWRNSSQKRARWPLRLRSHTVAHWFHRRWRPHDTIGSRSQLRPMGSILVARETPLSLIHINNMKAVTEAGGIICPATPSFYSHPQTIEQLAATVTNRALSLAGFETNSYKWGEKQ